MTVADRFVVFGAGHQYRKLGIRLYMCRRKGVIAVRPIGVKAKQLIGKFLFQSRDDLIAEMDEHIGMCCIGPETGFKLFTFRAFTVRWAVVGLQREHRSLG